MSSSFGFEKTASFFYLRTKLASGTRRKPQFCRRNYAPKSEGAALTKNKLRCGGCASM
jgi:hypothetical protein